MATHSSILAWEITQTRGAWRTTVHGVAKEIQQQRQRSREGEGSEQGVGRGEGGEGRGMGGIEDISRGRLAHLASWWQVQTASLQATCQYPETQ